MDASEIVLKDTADLLAVQSVAKNRIVLRFHHLVASLVETRIAIVYFAMMATNFPDWSGSGKIV